MNSTVSEIFMGFDEQRYSEIIINQFLKLKKGEALSINTDEKDFDLAKIIASNAILVSDVQVKIVITENGKPVDVTEFDPENPFTKVTGMALLRIAHVEESNKQDGQVLDVTVDKDDLAAIQKLGHLAEPVILNRRIAIAYCVVPSVPYFDFENINDRVFATDYRTKFLNHTDIDAFHFVGKNTDFTVKILQNSRFTNSHIVLSNGRDFINDSEFEKIMFTVDKNSLNGSFEAEYTVLGKKYKSRFEYKNGNLISYEQSRELKILFGFDMNLTKPGYLEFKDRQFILNLGGSLLSCLKQEPEDLEDLDDSFNTSLYKIKLNLDENLNVYYIGCDGTEHEIARKGFFLE